MADGGSPRRLVPRPPATWACDRCQAENPTGTRFCGHCGAPAVAAPGTEAAPGHLGEERRLVTALFADVSGFSSLAERLDPEQLADLIDPLIARLTDIIVSYGGYVEKYAGDAVLALFGAPVSHEDDAIRALHVALDMHAELDRPAGQLPPEVAGLALHIGVDSGHAVARVVGKEARMDYSVLGESVVVAQRMEAAAPRGQTYVAEATYRLARDHFEFEPVGELEVKGKRAPVTAWRLLGPRTSSTPRRGPAGGSLVGRDAEVRAVVAAVADAAGAEPQGSVCLVTGEAGIGKTALTDEVRRRAGDMGVRWLDARCLSYGSSVPYWPYVHLLRSLLGLPVAPVDTPSDLDVARRLRAAVPETPLAAAPFFARLLGQDSPESAGMEPEARQRGLHRAFSALLRAIVEEGPVVVAIEDVHWIDAASLTLTAELARLCRTERLVLYVTGRPATTVAQLAEAVPEHLRTVTLGPLGPADVGAVVRGVLGSSVAPALEAAVLARSGGNPFFVEEVARWLVESESAPRAAVAEVEQLPPTIEGLLSARIDRLPRSAAHVLQVASVIGREVPTALLAAVVDRGDLRPALDELVAAGLLDEASRGVAFHHVLVQEAAYGRLLRRHRRDLHLRVATAAERLYGSADDVVALLARHHYLAGSDLALGYLRRAADVARQLFANDEAILHLRRAAEVAGAAPEADILLDLADLLELHGDYGEALATYGQVAETTGRLRAWLGACTTLCKLGRHQEALDVLDGASSTLAGDDPAEGVVELARARALNLARRPAEAVEACHRGLRIAPSGSADEGWLLLQLSRAEVAQGHIAPALDHGLRAQQIFEGCGDLRGQVTAMRSLGSVYRHLDRHEDSAAALRRGLELAERVGNVEELGGCLINLGVLEMQRGALDEAVDLYQRAIEEFERVGHESGRANGYANLADTLARAGRHDEALAFCERAADVGRRIDDRLAVADSLCTRARVQRARGEQEAAARSAEDAAELFLAMGDTAGARQAQELASAAWAVNAEESGSSRPSRAGAEGSDRRST